MIPALQERTRIVRALSRDLHADVHIAQAGELPQTLGDFDAAVVGAGVKQSELAHLGDLPSVVVGAKACERAIPELSRFGVQSQMPSRCLQCTGERLLATEVLWAIERARLMRRLRLSEERHQHAALHDPLTGLSNVRLFKDRLRQLVAQGKRTQKPFALFILDLDRFKAVNDRWGHETGDRLLCAVADALRECIRESDTVARIGGDEFAILYDDVRHGTDTDHLARRILQRVSRPWIAAETVLRPSLSIGIALFAEDGVSAVQLEAEADRAMYAAKRSGGNAFRRAARGHGGEPGPLGGTRTGAPRRPPHASRTASPHVADLRASRSRSAHSSGSRTSRTAR